MVEDPSRPRLVLTTLRGEPRREVVPSDIGQSEITTLEEVPQLLVVQAEQRENAGVQIVDVDPVHRRMQPDFVPAPLPLPPY